MTSTRRVLYATTGFRQEMELRMVLVGKTGAGKSATGNTILGENRFEAELCMSSVTQKCEKARGMALGRRVMLVDTPGLFDTAVSQEDIQKEVLRCLAMSSPGPHAVLLVLQIGRFTEEEQRSVEIIQRIFQGDAAHHTILIFTHADKLKGQSIQDFISKQDQRIQDLVERFGRRFLAFNNEDQEDHAQVAKLLDMVDRMLMQNANPYFTNQAFQKMDQALMAFQQKHLEGKQEQIKREKKSAREKWETDWARFTNQMSEKRQVAVQKKQRIEQRIQMLNEKIAEASQQLKGEREKLRQLEVEENTRKERERAFRKQVDNEIRKAEKEIEDQYSENARQEAEGSSDFLWKVGIFVGGAAILATGVAGITIMTTSAAAASAGTAAAGMGGIAGAGAYIAGMAAEVGPAVAAVAAEVGPAAVAMAQQVAPLLATQCCIQ